MARWLGVLKEEAAKGFHPDLPKYGFGDPTSYDIISKMADGQPLRLVLNGENLLLDQPANEGCEGVSYVQTEKPNEDAADDGVITNEEADAIQDRS